MTDRQIDGLASDIAKLRNEGVSDDKILSSYRGYAPHHAPDIDRLVSEGISAKEIMDGVSVLEAQNTDAAAQDTQGALEKTGKALQYGAAQAAVGLGRTAHWLGEASGINTAKSVGETIAQAGRGIAPNDYRPASAEFFNPQDADRGVGGYGWSYLPRMVLEGAPGLAMDIAAGAATGGAGFLASNAARSFGPAIDARVENNGGKEASASDYAIAAGSSALQAYLGKVGLNPALSSVAKGAGLGAVAQIPGQIAKAGAVDAASGAAGAVIDRAAVTAGTDKGLTIDPHEVLGSAVASGATGGAIRSLRGIGDVTNAGRYADMDPAVAQRLATRIENLGIEPNNPEQAFKAVQITDDFLSSDISRARGDYDTGAGYLARQKSAEAMDTVESILGSGGMLTDKHFAELRRVIGDHRAGRRYVESIEERNALNNLKTKGRFEDGAFAGGLSSSPIVEGMINPASWIKNPTKRALGGTAAIIGLGTELEAARALLAPVALAKSMAIQGAAYGGIRALDAITGSRNPVGEFTSRFSGQGAARATAGTQERPMQRALSDAEAAQVQEAVRKAAGGAVEAQQRASLGNGSSNASKAASESTRGSGERIDSNMIRIEVGPYVVERPREGIANVGAYVAKAKSRMEARAEFGSELRAVTEGHQDIIQGLINRLNNKARTFTEAASLVEDAINELPWPMRSPAWDVFGNHEARLRGTY